MRSKVQEFAACLLDYARTSEELNVMLNYGPSWCDGNRSCDQHTLERLKLAIKYKQKSVSNLLQLNQIKLMLVVSL